MAKWLTVLLDIAFTVGKSWWDKKKEKQEKEDLVKEVNNVDKNGENVL